MGAEGSCEKIENRLLPALSVRRSARATQVERALRARFHLWARRRNGSGWLHSILLQLQGKRVQLADMHNRGVGYCNFVEMAAEQTVTLMEMNRWKTDWRCYTGRDLWSKLANMDPKPHSQCCVEVACRGKNAGRCSSLSQTIGIEPVFASNTQQQ